MKKLMILAAAAMLTFSAIGCQFCPLHKWRQAAFRGNSCAPASSCSTCSPGGSPIIGDTYLAPPPAITPGPVTTQ